MKTKQKKEWVIQHESLYDDNSGEPLFWNNEDGWVDEMGATIFDDFEMETYTHIPEGGTWILA
jgi:hypothetical protein